MDFAGRLTDIGKSIHTQQGFLFTPNELTWTRRGIHHRQGKKLKETTTSKLAHGWWYRNQNLSTCRILFSSLCDTQKESSTLYCTTTTSHHSHNHNFHVTHCTTIINTVILDAYIILLLLCGFSRCLYYGLVWLGGLPGLSGDRDPSPSTRAGRHNGSTDE